jgi:hypothetical protein
MSEQEQRRSHAAAGSNDDSIDKFDPGKTDEEEQEEEEETKWEPITHPEWGLGRRHKDTGEEQYGDQPDEDDDELEDGMPMGGREGGEELPQTEEDKEVERRAREMFPDEWKRIDEEAEKRRDYQRQEEATRYVGEEEPPAQQGPVKGAAPRPVARPETAAQPKEGDEEEDYREGQKVLELGVEGGGATIFRKMLATGGWQFHVAGSSMYLDENDDDRWSSWTRDGFKTLLEALQSVGDSGFWVHFHPISIHPEYRIVVWQLANETASKLPEDQRRRWNNHSSWIWRQRCLENQ